MKLYRHWVGYLAYQMCEISNSILVFLAGIGAGHIVLIEILDQPELQLSFYAAVFAGILVSNMWYYYTNRHYFEGIFNDSVEKSKEYKSQGYKSQGRKNEN